MGEDNQNPCTNGISKNEVILNTIRYFSFTGEQLSKNKIKQDNTK